MRLAILLAIMLGAKPDAGTHDEIDLPGDITVTFVADFARLDLSADTYPDCRKPRKISCHRGDVMGPIRADEAVGCGPVAVVCVRTDGGVYGIISYSDGGQ